MMMHLCSDILNALQGKTLVTAESCTGGGIGAAITAVSGSSKVYKGGIISYSNEIKAQQLHVPADVLRREGAVSGAVAEAMAAGAREVLAADVAVSVTGLAGPDGDEFGNPVGTVFIGYADQRVNLSKKYLFSGNREEIRQAAIKAALELILEQNENILRV